MFILVYFLVQLFLTVPFGSTLFSTFGLECFGDTLMRVVGTSLLICSKTFSLGQMADRTIITFKDTVLIFHSCIYNVL